MRIARQQIVRGRGFKEHSLLHPRHVVAVIAKHSGEGYLPDFGQLICRGISRRRHVSDYYELELFSTSMGIFFVVVRSADFSGRVESRASKYRRKTVGTLVSFENFVYASIRAPIIIFRNNRLHL